MNLELEINKKIIEKAAELFLIRGFKSVTMDDLANEMAISKKTIYNHFSTKNDLVAKAAEFTFDLIENGINEIRSQNLDPIEELYVINDFVHENLRNEVSAPAYQLLKYYTEVYNKLKKRKFNAVCDCITANLKRGIEKEIYRNDFSQEIVARIYFLNITGLSDQEIFPNKIYKPKTINHEYLEYHIRGIATSKGILALEKIKQNRKP